MTENHVEYEYDHYSMDIQFDRRDNIYVVTVHELNDSHTHGKTYEEAVSQGRDLIETVLDARKEWGQPIPPPRYFDLEPDQQGDDEDWDEDEDDGEDIEDVEEGVEGPPILPAVNVEYEYDHYSMDIQYDRRSNIYVVTVHELSEFSNCQTDGKTYEEAVSQGRDLIATWLDHSYEKGTPIPQPRYFDLEPDQQGDDDWEWENDEDEGGDDFSKEKNVA